LDTQTEVQPATNGNELSLLCWVAQHQTATIEAFREQSNTIKRCFNESIAWINEVKADQQRKFERERKTKSYEAGDYVM
jgi:hypothetical protein